MALSTRACENRHLHNSLRLLLIYFVICSIVTHRVDLEDFPALYRVFDKRVPGLEKVIVDTKFSKEFGRRGSKCPQLTRIEDIEFVEDSPDEFPSIN
mgnify:CR=1 FL=1